MSGSVAQLDSTLTAAGWAPGPTSFGSQSWTRRTNTGHAVVSVKRTDAGVMGSMRLIGEHSDEDDGPWTTEDVVLDVGPDRDERGLAIHRTEADVASLLGRYAALLEAVPDDDTPSTNTCPRCRHRAHGSWCANAASDGDCSCTFDSTRPLPRP